MFSSKTLFIWFFLSIFIVVIIAECPNIVTKKQWRGRTSEEIDYILIPVKYAIIEHTASQECDSVTDCSEKIRNIQDYHMDNLELNDIGYNFLIGNDGNVYEGVGWHKQGAHTYGWNRKSIGIAFMGNFQKKLPSQLAIDAAKNLLECGVNKGELSTDYKLYGHSQLIAIESPGKRLYELMVNWPNYSELVD